MGRQTVLWLLVLGLCQCSHALKLVLTGSPWARLVLQEPLQTLLHSLDLEESSDWLVRTLGSQAVPYQETYDRGCRRWMSTSRAVEIVSLLTGQELGDDATRALLSPTCVHWASADLLGSFKLRHYFAHTYPLALLSHRCEAAPHWIPAEMLPRELAKFMEMPLRMIEPNVSWLLLLGEHMNVIVKNHAIVDGLLWRLHPLLVREAGERRMAAVMQVALRIAQAISVHTQDAPSRLARICVSLGSLLFAFEGPHMHRHNLQHPLGKEVTYFAEAVEDQLQVLHHILTVHADAKDADIVSLQEFLHMLISRSQPEKPKALFNQILGLCTLDLEDGRLLEWEASWMARLAFVFSSISLSLTPEPLIVSLPLLHYVKVAWSYDVLLLSQTIHEFCINQSYDYVLTVAEHSPAFGLLYLDQLAMGTTAYVRGQLSVTQPKVTNVERGILDVIPLAIRMRHLRLHYAMIDSSAPDPTGMTSSIANVMAFFKCRSSMGKLEELYLEYLWEMGLLAGRGRLCLMTAVRFRLIGFILAMALLFGIPIRTIQESQLHLLMGIHSSILLGLDHGVIHLGSFFPAPSPDSPMADETPQGNAVLASIQIFYSTIPRVKLLAADEAIYLLRHGTGSKIDTIRSIY